MKMSFKRLAALATMGLSMGMSAYAQPMAYESGDWAGERMEHHRAQMAKFQEKRLTALKAKLQLGAQQESAWTAFAQAHQPQTTDKAPARLDREALAKMHTPERLEEMQKHAEAHHLAAQAQMRRVADATRLFYAQLSPEQQKVFDAETLSPMAGHHAKGPGMMGRERR